MLFNLPVCPLAVCSVGFFSLRGHPFSSKASESKIVMSFMFTTGESVLGYGIPYMVINCHQLTNECAGKIFRASHEYSIRHNKRHVTI